MLPNPDNLPTQVAWRTLNLLVERKALIHPDGVAFYVWQRGDRLVVAFDPNAIDTERVNDEFAHRLSTRLHGRKVVRTNSRGLFFQVGMDIPAAPTALDAVPLDLSRQPSPWHMPVGMTASGPLWVSLLEGDSFLVGGSRGGGKTGLEHGWIQALLHGGQTLVFAWDGKRGAEFGRYVGRERFHLMFGAWQELSQLQEMLKQREQALAESGYPNIVEHNKAGMAFIPPVALFVDEAADLPDGAKDLLKSMIRLYRHVGLYPVIATNQPVAAEMFVKTNLSTRIAMRVPHHIDSITVLGYKGAESLDPVRGRGLIVWQGRMIEFQSFDVPYPMPSEAARKMISEQVQGAGPEVGPVENEIERLGDSIREQWSPEMSKRAVGRLLGRDYAGSWASKIDRVVAYLNATTTPNTPVFALDGAVA